MSFTFGACRLLFLPVIESTEIDGIYKKKSAIINSWRRKN